MNVLPFDQQVAVIAALTEGCSIRATERLTGVHRDTIMRLAARVGFGAIKLHDRTVHSLQVPRLELDEAWSFVGKKQRRCTPSGRDRKGRSIRLSRRIGVVEGDRQLSGRQAQRGKHQGILGLARADHQRARNLNRWLDAYQGAIEEAFGAECRYGQIVKTYVGEPAINAARRYSPGYVVAVDRRSVIGAPRQISTSYAERQNLTLRMASRRFTRLTNGFSKRADYHLAAVGLYVAHFNFCRVHEALRITPAMAQRLTDHVWTIGELLTACLENAPTKPRKVHRRFTVIQGGHA